MSHLYKETAKVEPSEERPKPREDILPPTNMAPEGGHPKDQFPLQGYQDGANARRLTLSSGVLGAHELLH